MKCIFNVYGDEDDDNDRNCKRTEYSTTSIVTCLKLKQLQWPMGQTMIYIYSDNISYMYLVYVYVQSS